MKHDPSENEHRLLIVDDEENMRHMLATLLSRFGYRIEAAADGMQALEKVRGESYDFILCDLKMPRMDGMGFLEAARDHLSETTVIMMSAYGSIDTAIEAMKRGAYDYISKPFKTDEVYLALKKAEERESLRRENTRLRREIEGIREDFSFGNMVGRSKAMQAIFQLARKVAQYSTTVLITGESGTGKELVARGIHIHGNRAARPFIAVNCGGIPENLLESEFFGYRKGAFTGADRNRKGLFEEADGGTIFLDEIGELPLPLQVKFLRVLQESEIRPIGEAKSRKVDVRVIAATAKNLEEEVRRSRFREDLFYRLNVMPVHLPPLRERPEDIALLCRHFIRRFNGSLGKNIEGVSPEAMNLLMGHAWRGNVRELENMLERALILAEGRILQPAHFPDNLDPTPPEGGIPETLFESFSLKRAQRIIEKHLITKALEETGGNRTKAIQLLEISHPSLLSKIRAYDIRL
jgi:two-component system, NtrC family, response regulator AtoC